MSNCYYNNYRPYAGDEIKETLIKVCDLQKKAVKKEYNEHMCDFNSLGNCNGASEFNTRPLQIFTINDQAWHCPIDGNQDGCGTPEDTTTCVFRVEKVDGDVAVFRALVEQEVPGGKVYLPTDSYITIKLAYISAIRCLNDTFVDLCIR